MPARIATAASAFLVAAVLLNPGALAAAASEAAAVAASTSASAGAAAKITHTTAAALQDMLTTAVEKEGGVKTEEGDTFRVELRDRAKVLFFTRPGHRAHPAVIEVHIVQRDGKTKIDTSGEWAGDRDAFENWFDAFVRHNERLSREWQKH